MPPHSATRSISRAPSAYNKPPLKRALGTAETPDTQRQRVSIAPRASSTYSRRTSAGTPAPIEPRSRQDIAIEEEDDSSEHIILAVDKTSRGSVGCSYYTAREGTLLCMEDIENADQGTVDWLKLHIQPTVILLSPRLEMPNQDMARSNSLSAGDDEEVALPYKLELRPGADFKYEQALQKLAKLSNLEAVPDVKFLVPGEEEQYDLQNLPDEMGLTNEKGLELHISGCINLESKVSIGCAGALITYLQRKRQSDYMQGDPAAEQAYQILRLEMFSLKDTMLVNSDTLVSLQILQPESHPNAAQQGPGASGSKESLSIYGLFHHFAKTPQGRKRLRNVFLQPSTSLNVINERHDSVSVFVKPNNQDSLTKLSRSLTKIKNLRRIMVQLHKGIEGGNSAAGGIKSGVWSSLLDFCFHVIDISETLQEIVGIERVPLYRRLRNSFKRADLRRIGKIIWEVVDLEESQAQRRTVIKRGINMQLDTVKDAYDGMDDMLQQAAIETVRELPTDMDLPSLSVVYIPQLGFQITMPLDASDVLVTRGLNAEWERMFKTDTHAYFKNDKMRTMDGELGDLWALICDAEIEVSHDLAQQVLECETFLVDASDLCGELDTLLALAHGALEYKLSRPRMVEDNVIDICAGRHLIQEMTVASYVANDTFLVGGGGACPGAAADATEGLEINDRPRDPTMLLLTGPNYSGKSVYLKQIALIVYMAQVGSFVPAELARLGITDKIMTRIATRETVSKGQSSFMIDLQQISWALKACTPRSLLVIDEFGKGTDTCDGAGLATGVFTYLLSLGTTAPKVLASTHFHEIFEQGLMSEDIPGLAPRQMEVYVKTKNKVDGEREGHNSEVTYLYNVRPGRSTLSYGTQCAAMNGIPSEVVERACKLTDLAIAGEDLVAACSQIPAEEMKELEEVEAISRAFLQLDLHTFGTASILNSRQILEDLIANSPPPCTTTSSNIDTPRLSF